MKNKYNWLRKNRFEAYTLAFLMMIVPSALLYPSAEHNAFGLIWILISVIILANLFVLALK